MNSFKVTLCICIFAAFVYGELDPQNIKSVVPRKCLYCICVASTGCDKNAKCVGNVCGPYRISLGYWIDSGRPNIKDKENGNDSQKILNYSDLDYRRCANNLTCASRSVEGYMIRYRRDCDGDGLVNCDDFARIHSLGPLGCSGYLDAKYKYAYENCINHEP